MHEVPEAGASSRGRALAQLLNLDRKGRVAALLAVNEFAAERSLLFLTAGGTVKRTALDQFAHIRAGGIVAIALKEDDRLLDVQISDGTKDVVLVTRQGRAIRFPETEIPLMGRAAQGVKGIGLRKDDAVVGMVVVRREAALCTITEQGFAKRTLISEYPVQRRGGLGTQTLAVTEKTGALVAAKELLPGDEIMILSAGGGATRAVADSIPLQGRATQGKQVFKPAAGDRVADVARVAMDRNGHGEDAAGAAEEEDAVEEAEDGGKQDTGADQLELIDYGS